MKDFIKTFLTGLLVIILSPFIVVFFGLATVFAVFLFFVMFIKHIILFFKGHNMKEPMGIDEEASRRLKALTAPSNETQVTKEAPTTVVQPQPQQVIIQSMPGTVISTGVGPNGQPIIIANNQQAFQNVETNNETNPYLSDKVEDKNHD